MKTFSYVCEGIIEYARARPDHFDMEALGSKAVNQWDDIMEMKNINEMELLEKSKKSGKSSPLGSQASIKSKVDIMDFIR